MSALGQKQTCALQKNMSDPVDLKDREGLNDLLNRHASEVREYLAAIKARPIAAERVDPAKLPSDWKSLRLHSAVPVPRRNGSQR